MSDRSEFSLFVNTVPVTSSYVHVLPADVLHRGEENKAFFGNKVYVFSFWRLWVSPLLMYRDREQNNDREKNIP